MKLHELMHVIAPIENVLIVDQIGREISDYGAAGALRHSRRYERLREHNVLCVSAADEAGRGQYIEVVIDFAEG